MLSPDCGAAKTGSTIPIKKKVSVMNTASKMSFVLTAAIVFACGGPESANPEVMWDSSDESSMPEAQLETALLASSGFVGVSASVSDQGYPAANAIDGNLATDRK